MKDFFVSYNRHDQDWAEWIAWQLEAAGYTVVIQAWDFRPGGNFALQMHEATREAKRTVAVLSPTYLSSAFTQPEWAAAFARDPGGAERLLLPVRVRECELNGLLSQIVYADLVGLSDEDAKARLLSAVASGRIKPAVAPPFPKVTFPAARPQPAYSSDFARGLGEEAEALRQKERDLLCNGATPSEIAKVERELLDVKRRLRDGPILKAGDCLSNRYLLVEVLGSGGFATVWKAFDETRRQQVAVKVLHGWNGSNTDRLDRFRRGARAMERLDHPHIVRVLASDLEDGGHHYFVMEYLEGGTFAQAIIAGTLTLEQRLKVVLDIGEALAFAHSLGVLHRDVTPDNILLGLPGSPARLSDFDLVRLSDDTGGTRTGPMGKFLYAAPECMESAGDVDERSDVYSLGMTAIFAIHGAKLPASVIRGHEAFVGKLACSEDVKAAVAKATASEAKERFDTVDTFCKVLRRETATVVNHSRNWKLSTGVIGQTIRNKLGMTFAWVPPGLSWLGGGKGKPGMTEFALAEGLWCGVYQVTQAEWAAVMNGATPSHFVGNPRHPVESVSFNDVEQFLAEINQKTAGDGLLYRLPPRAEWEYICRGGPLSLHTQSAYDFYFARSKDDHTPAPTNDLDSTKANFDGNYPAGSAGKGRNLNKACDVGLYLPNPLAVYDMHGNVWEWTSTQGGSSRVIRGGSWYDDGVYCAAAYRDSLAPGNADSSVGFRLLAVPSQT